MTKMERELLRLKKEYGLSDQLIDGAHKGWKALVRGAAKEPCRKMLIAAWRASIISGMEQAARKRSEGR